VFTKLVTIGSLLIMTALVTPGAMAAESADAPAAGSPSALPDGIKKLQFGVQLSNVPPDDVAAGASVLWVQAGSVAEKAGIKQGDLIVRFGDLDIATAKHLLTAVRETPAGSKVQVTLVRKNERLTLTAQF
jgi:S1-C subfamily serine protease